MTWGFTWQPMAVLRPWIHCSLDWAQSFRVGFRQYMERNKKSLNRMYHVFIVVWLVIRLKVFIQIYLCEWMTFHLTFISQQDLEAVEACHKWFLVFSRKHCWLCFIFEFKFCKLKLWYDLHLRFRQLWQAFSDNSLFLIAKETIRLLVCNQ